MIAIKQIKNAGKYVWTPVESFAATWLKPHKIIPPHSFLKVTATLQHRESNGLYVDGIIYKESAGFWWFLFSSETRDRMVNLNTNPYRAIHTGLPYGAFGIPYQTREILREKYPYRVALYNGNKRELEHAQLGNVKVLLPENFKRQNRLSSRR